MVLKQLWKNVIEDKLGMREHIEILLNIFFIEKLENYSDCFAASSGDIPNQHYLYNSFETVLEFLTEFINQENFLRIIYFHNDCQIYGYTFLTTFCKLIPKLVRCKYIPI